MGKKAKVSVTAEDFDRAKLAQLQKLIDKKRSDLEWHHAVGRLVEDLLPGRDYGRKKKLIEVLGGKSKNVSATSLFNARDFAGKYSEQDLPTLQGLTFNHVCRLFPVPDNRREWYREQCQKNRWSSRQLTEKINEEFDRQSEGGRSLKELPLEKLKKVGPKAALRLVPRLRDMAVNRCVPMLAQNEARLAKRMSRRSDDELVALVNKACSALDELHKEVTKARTMLRQIKSAGKTPTG
jgi:hypothetical protein